MTLEQLRIFVEVAARQHVTRAAEHLMFPRINSDFKGAN